MNVLIVYKYKLKCQQIKQNLPKTHMPKAATIETMSIFVQKVSDDKIIHFNYDFGQSLTQYYNNLLKLLNHCGKFSRKKLFILSNWFLIFLPDTTDAILFRFFHAIKILKEFMSWSDGYKTMIYVEHHCGGFTRGDVFWSLIALRICENYHQLGKFHIALLKNIWANVTRYFH